MTSANTTFDILSQAKFFAVWDFAKNMLSVGIDKETIIKTLTTEEVSSEQVSVIINYVKDVESMAMSMEVLK